MDCSVRSVYELLSSLKKDLSSPNTVETQNFDHPWVKENQTLYIYIARWLVHIYSEIQLHIKS